MENYSDATSEKVRKYISDDVTFLILSKLPLKSLKRFGCVHKSWALLFENPQFMSIFCKNFITSNCSYYDDTSLLLQPSLLNSQLLTGERFEYKANFVWPNPFQDEDPDFHILDSGSITGIICLYILPIRVVLWNPAIDEFKIIPDSPIAEPLPDFVFIPVILHGFGYDHVRDDYKLLRYVRYFSDHADDFSLINEYRDPLWEIYSLRNNSWRQLDVNVPVRIALGNCNGERIYKDGMCHWSGVGESTRYNDEAKYMLSSFDLSNEVFFTTPITPDIVDNNNFDLVLLNGSISLISWDFTNGTIFHIIVLGELGVKESWTKLITVEFPWDGWFAGVGKNGDIFMNRYGYLVRFDLNTHQIEEFNIEVNHYSYVLVYKKNLISLEE